MQRASFVKGNADGDWKWYRGGYFGSAAPRWISGAVQSVADFPAPCVLLGCWEATTADTGLTTVDRSGRVSALSMIKNVPDGEIVQAADPCRRSVE